MRERRHAASRAPSVRSDLGEGSSRLPEFAQPRCRLERATFADSRRTKCSDDRRARVCGPSEGRHLLDREWLVALDLECMRFVWRMPMPCPSSGTTGHPLSPACPSAMGGSPLPTVDHRPRPVFRRRPAKSIAFPRTGVPFTVTYFTAEAGTRLLASACPRRPPAHAAPTFSPGWGEC